MEHFYDTDYEILIAKNKCPWCGWFLKKRQNHSTGEKFMGCSNYDKNGCEFTISRRDYLEIWHKYNKKQ